MVSVVATILNEAENIEKLLKALVSQTKRPGEIIIVDGGSKDGTIEIVRKFSSRNKIVKLLEKHGNRSVGRNHGIKHAKGDVIAVTDAGGYPKEDWLEKITHPFVYKKVKVVSGFYRSKSVGTFQKCIAPYFLVMPSDTYKGMNFRPSSRSVAFYKEVWQSVPYPEKYDHNEDLVWDIQLEKAGFGFYFQPEAIVYWYPPKNLFIALRQFYRFAYGDAESGVSRPKVFTIFIRYLLFGFLIWLYEDFLIVLVPYSVWSVVKNWGHTKTPFAIFWLPVIQITSDFAIMLGYIRGRIAWLLRQ